MSFDNRRTDCVDDKLYRMKEKFNQTNDYSVFCLPTLDTVNNNLHVIIEEWISNY